MKRVTTAWRQGARSRATGRTARAALVGAVLSTATSAAWAQSAAASRADAGSDPQAAASGAGGSPVVLRVTPREGSLRWAFALENTSDAPVDVVADRRLLWLEVTPAAQTAPEPQPTGRGRRARPTRPARCVASLRPPTIDGVPRAHLAAGARYEEGFDVRDLCGMRLPAALVPGATLTVHYGFRGRPSFAHAVVLDRRDPPTVDLAATPFAVPGTLAAWPPPPPEAPRGDGRVHVTASGAPQAATIRSLAVRVRVEGASPYPLRAFFRTGLLRFYMVSPLGRPISCVGAPQEYAPMREFFVTLRQGRPIARTVHLGDVCPEEAFAMAGVYRAQAVYETHVGGAAAAATTFQGASASPYFYFRITRGVPAGPYQPLPVADPWARRDEQR